MMNNKRERVHIINNLFLDKEGKSLSIGGVETYIRNLCKIFIEEGFEPRVYQQANKEFEVIFENIIVKGIASKRKCFAKQVIRMLPSNEIVIFANDEVVYGKYKGKVINLQHGIGWDFQKHQYRGAFFEQLLRIESFIENTRRIRYSQYADVVVCVDYNYVNWFKTQVNRVDSNFVVIPNFTQVLEHFPKKVGNPLKIIFARRFTPYRGTRLFTKAICRILDEYNNIEVTFAGTGPDEEWIKEQTQKYANVKFIRYNNAESLLVHADKDIAVVPSVGSEGTSLSLLEAMAGGCAVICTNVGGMTNIVLDAYNGVIIPPQEEELYAALKQLIDNTELRKQLSVNGYNTVVQAFSYEKWKRAWVDLIEKELMSYDVETTG